MKIYLVRHAAAVEASYEMPDTARYLTSAGRENARAIARVLKEQKVEFDAMVASPLVRAQQTAELLASGLDYFGEIRTHVALSPESRPQPFLVDLPIYGGAVCVVGHEPNLSELTGLIVGQPGGAPYRNCHVKAFDGPQPLWTLHPQTLQFQDHFVPTP